MDPKAQLGFFYEIELQCQFVVWAGDQLREAEAAHLPEDAPLVNKLRRTERIWFALQSLLVAAGNLSKLLWGGGKPAKRARQEASRRPLRATLDVSDDSPLKPVVDLRNSFEHMDERIERWETTGDPRYVARSVSNYGDMADDVPVFGHYSEQAGVLRFWGLSVSVLELIAEAERLLPLARAQVKSPH